MFYANGGSSWNDSSNWLSNQSHCTWTGITCDVNSHVTSVALGGNNLTGGMTDLSGLSALDGIYLTGNAMSGAIPSPVCNKVIGGTLYLEGDDGICNDVLTPPGCCNLSLGSSKTIEKAIEQVLGTSDCSSVATIEDADSCQWMSDPLHHPPHSPEGLLNHLTVSLFWRLGL